MHRSSQIRPRCYVVWFLSNQNSFSSQPTLASFIHRSIYAASPYAAAKYLSEISKIRIMAQRMQWPMYIYIYIYNLDAISSKLGDGVWIKDRVSACVFGKCIIRIDCISRISSNQKKVGSYHENLLKRIISVLKGATRIEKCVLFSILSNATSAVVLSNVAIDSYIYIYI